jgi:sortase A
MEWVFSSDVSVLNPVPNLLVEAKDRILTMTTCHPKLSSAERFISFSVFESFVPRVNGAPAEVARMKISH